MEAAGQHPVVDGPGAGGAQRLVRRFGPAALAWYREVPDLVAGLAERWDLEVLAAGGGGTALLYRCARGPDGTPVWLKLTPDPLIARQEALALTAWAAVPSVVGLLAYEPAAGALLLAGVEPGSTLRGRPWRTAEVGRLLAALRAPVGLPPGLPRLAERTELVFDLALRRDVPVAERCRGAARELAAGGPVALVHGDLHPANVLDGPDGPVAIDPRPCLGDPDFDLVDWAVAGVGGPAELTARIEELAALVPAADGDRVLAWCRALAPLLLAPGRDDPLARYLGLT
ncbi:aminoglycoside phosphotransferase family protein [Kitasatospora sp. MBT63]|uniref:aminoglycoside phosphotransferase family protein n=1 Tax=Kitasatospora sp. MBT63 TaxID=1444768 RepID=UPI000A51F122|nr:aminoglycoside phosphotransferase family protein [Kitasatospora sp. MBT63]